MVTFSKVPEDKKTARAGWQAVMKYLRKSGITGFVKAMELGPKNGMRHYHVLLVGASRVDLEALNAICEFHNHGFVWATRVRSKQRASRYILKYPLKDMGSTSYRFRGWRAVTASRSIPSWKDVTKQYRKDDYVEEGWYLSKNGQYSGNPRPDRAVNE